MENHPAIDWLDGGRYTLAIAETGLAIAVHGSWIGLAGPDASAGFVADAPESVIAAIEDRIGPRWVWWDRATADFLARHDLALSRSWDVTVVQQLLDGGPRHSPMHVWATLSGLPTSTMPMPGQLDLGAAMGTGVARAEPVDPAIDPAVDAPVDAPVRPDGHIDPDWADGGWAAGPKRLAAWAQLALRAAELQRDRIRSGPAPDRTMSTAHAESACELLCAELGVGGLPIDEPAARRIVTDRIGPRPADHRDENRLRNDRDTRVLDLVAPSPQFDLRNPADVRALLRWIGLDLPDTRMWRLELHRDHHPVIDALIEWRIAERIATTFGHRWLDSHVDGGRLRGTWSSSDGAAGRMTATAGLHNLPTELRPAIRADPGHRFVRADLGQIEPRILAAVSGDRSLIAATADDDMYRPIADRLGVDRPTAKLAVLGAMYGATTGNSAAALRALHQNFPTAIAYLEHAAEVGRTGDPLRTIGGRRIHTSRTADLTGPPAAAQGRFARNAVVQGAAAEFFKVWAAIVRARCKGSGTRIVLCLHDELILHVPDVPENDDIDRNATTPTTTTTTTTATTMAMMTDALTEAGHRWSPHAGVRFVADISTVERWSDAG